MWGIWGRDKGCNLRDPGLPEEELFQDTPGARAFWRQHSPVNVSVGVRGGGKDVLSVALVSFRTGHLTAVRESQ